MIKKENKQCQILIADDLTGAMDTGVFLSKIYPKVSVLFEKDFIGEEANQNDAVIIDTESRNLEPDIAHTILNEYLEQIEQLNSDIIYKKVDSTLRGNIGPELEAVLARGNFDLALIAPALPANGRTTKSGFHYIDGKLLTESDLASDPFSPIKSAYIPDIIKEKAKIDAAVIELSEIRKGKKRILEIINGIYTSGCQAAVADAENYDDLSLIAAALSNSRMKILPCGSAGLFSKIFEDSPQIGADGANILNDKPVIVISGSPAEVSKAQIEYAEKQGEYVIRVDDAALTSVNEDDCTKLNRINNEIKKVLSEGRNIIIDAAGAGKKELSDKYQGKQGELFKASEKLQDVIKCILEDIIIKTEISGIMIFGGDTAINICKNFRAKALRILGEIEPLVPYGVFVDGAMDGIGVATKAGGFGSENIIENAIDFFKSTAI